MNATLQTAGDITPPYREHSLSHNPVIRAVLKAGPAKLWGVKDLVELLGVSERSAQILLAEGIPSVLSFPCRGRGRKNGKKVTSGSLLLYLLRNAREEPQSEILAALGVILDELPTAILSQLVTHLQKKVTRRSARLVVVVSEEVPSLRPSVGQLDFFTSPSP